MIVEPRIEEYLRTLQRDPDPILQEMERLAALTGFPCVGPLVGSLLDVVVRTAGVRTVFEMGSGFGYSAAWIARALPEGGRVICTDRSETNELRARDFLARMGLLDRVEFLRGDALDAFSGYPGSLDMVFVDVDKGQYPAAFRAALDRLERGGLLVVDNMLWFGRVLENGDEETRAIKEATRMLYADARFRTVLLPLRDGVSVSLRI